MITKESLDANGGSIAVATHVAVHNAFSRYRGWLLARHPLLMDYLRKPR